MKTRDFQNVHLLCETTHPKSKHTQYLGEISKIRMCPPKEKMLLKKLGFDALTAASTTLQVRNNRPNLERNAWFREPRAVN